MPFAELTGWRKSTRSQQETACVEVARAHDGAAVRDTKNRAAGCFTTTASQWRDFLAAIKAGRFDG